MSLDIQEFLIHAADLRLEKREQVLVLFLCKKNQLLKKEIIATGSTKQIKLSAYHIFAPALLCRCHTIVLVHNHPSGKVFPSKDDYLTTAVIAEGAELLQLKLYDHVIVTQTEYYSFREAGIL